MKRGTEPGHLARSRSLIMSAPSSPSIASPALQRIRAVLTEGFDQGKLALPVLPMVAGRVMTLANDPNAKARRLARALISDLITYFPAKREEGLRDGTLKELFKEEIKKSYQEYSDQVGKEFAESTDHFRNALNEILAGGNHVF